MPVISNRALRNVQVNEAWALMMRVWSNPYSEETPEGIVAMGLAENKLMHKEVAEYLNNNINITTRMLTYGDGPSGTALLRESLSAFINAHFSPYPTQLVHPHQITVMSGVGACVDATCFVVADEGDGILIVRPAYVGFEGDLRDRAGITPVWVPVGTHSVTSLEAVQDHENALLDAEKDGIKVKGILLCNPHNPLGRCYTKEVLEAYLKLCSKHGIHLISDEVYAKAVFSNNDVPEPLPFTSVLSLDIKKFVDPSFVHVLYGMSKDFSSNGLRVGAIISLTSPTIHAALSTVSKFSWASSLADHAWTLLLKDAKWLEWYFEEMRTRLKRSYELCVGILRELGVKYVPANCGPFIWLDLRSFMKDSSFDGERHLTSLMLDNGVWLATGEAFKSEVPGWFRITFAVDEKEFLFGVGRLKKALASSSSAIKSQQSSEEVNLSAGAVDEKIGELQDQQPVVAVIEGVAKM